MNKHIKTTLGEVAEIITGPFGSMLHQSDYVPSGVPVIMPQDIGNRVLDKSQIAYVGEHDASRLSRYKVALADIVYARRGDVEKHAFIGAEDVGALCGTGCLRVRVDTQKASPLYISFYLNRPETRRWISQHAVGSNMPNLNTQILGDVPLELPEIDEQHRIVAILDSIDTKLQVNKEICAELDSMAKTIYDYWFTQFDFPDVDGKPYRSSGGVMEWNEQVNRSIPKGWSIGTISSLMKIENTSVNPKKLGNTAMEHYSIPAFDVDRCPAYEEASTIESSKYAVDPECILTSKLNPHFKRLWDPYCDTENAICSTEFIVYRPRTSWMRPFCYAVLNSDAFYIHMSSKATASTGSRKRIQPDVSASFELPIPDENTMRSFVALYSPIMEKQKALYKENRELTKLRNWLLPMLMNGQATVADAKEKVSKVIPFTTQTVEVRQAARNFGDKKTDDTADLVKAYMRRKQNDPKA